MGVTVVSSWILIVVMTSLAGLERDMTIIELNTQDGCKRISHEIVNRWASPDVQVETLCVRK